MIPQQVQEELDRLGPVDPDQEDYFVLGIAGTGVDVAKLFEEGNRAQARDRAATLAAVSIKLVEHFNRG